LRTGITALRTIGYAQWTPRETDYSRVRDGSTWLRHALQVIEGYSSEISEEVATVISLAVPLRVLSDAATPSGSVSFLPGLVYFSNVADDCRLAEMLLHECSHIKLHLLSDYDPLLDSEHHGDGWAAACYYSPWREDPRPIKGIL
jgi:HEXXH motif-containing protein